jgi:hypothetical protein
VLLTPLRYDPAILPRPASAQAPMTVGAPIARERIFEESRAIFPNPERGFYWPVTTGRLRNLSDLRQQGISLLFVESDLREFKERELSPEKHAGEKSRSRPIGLPAKLG